MTEKRKKTYSNMLKAELLEEAKGLGLTNLSKLRKSDILDLVKKAAALRDKKKAPARKKAARKAPAKKKAARKKAAPAKKKAAPKKAAPKKAARKKAAPAKKAVAKKAAPKKAAPRKAAPKSAAKKAAPKSAAKKAAPKRVRTKKAAAKAPAKAAAKRVRTKKAPAAAEPATKRVRTKKAAAKKAAPAKKAPAKKAPAKKAAAKKAPAKKAAAKKAPAKKAPAKKAAVKKAAPARKAPAKKAPAKKAAAKPVVRSPLAPVPAQAGAQASRYPGQAHPAPEELRGVDERLPELPDSYGDNSIVLLPRDPGWLFTYWDLTLEYKEAARQAGGQALALRLYDVTGTGFMGPMAHPFHEHECAEWARSWYLPVPIQGREYQAEIGYRGGTQWYPLARSNMVAVPTDQPAPEEGEDFTTITPGQELGEAPAADQAPAFQEQVLVDDGELRIIAVGSFAGSGAESSGQIDQRGVPGSLGHQPGSLGHQPGSLGHQPGSLGHQPGSLGHQPGSLGHQPGSLGLLQGLATRPDLAGTLLANEPGAWGDGTVAAGTPEAAGAVAPATLMEAMVEVVISGRSVPGARLTVAGQPIPTGPDGCFSLRISVPEGQREIPLKALEESSGKEKRINLRLGQDVEN